MMQLCLKIEHPALVAPRLNFLDAAAVHFGHPKFYKAECIVRKAAVAEPKPFAAFCLEVRKHLTLEKFNQHRFESASPSAAPGFADAMAPGNGASGLVAVPTAATDGDGLRGAAM